MPVTQDQPAPYAPASAILSLIDRYRNKGLPPVIDGDVLARAGVSPSLIARTLQAMQSLDLLTEEGKASPVLEGIRLAPEPEFKQRLVEWLNSAYADALQFVDPATATEGEIRDAFRSYKPIGQQNRMVTLFMGLFAGAGVGAEKPKASTPRKVAQPKPSGASTPRPTIRTAALPKTPGHPAAFNNSGMPPALSGLLASLPSPEDGWTKEERDRFVATFGAVLDFCFPVRAARKPKPVEPEGEDE